MLSSSVHDINGYDEMGADRKSMVSYGKNKGGIQWLQ